MVRKKIKKISEQNWKKNLFFINIPKKINFETKNLY